ncbi:pyridoxamine 5'-phosphate oxidase family protein [bacterium RCC_150]
MRNETPKPETEVLDPRECWKLLQGSSVGRFGVWVEDHPEIFPVNYRVDHGTVVLRSGEGTKLRAAYGGFPVAFEADGMVAASRVAWSVMVKGNASEVPVTDEFLDSVGLMLFPWEPGKKDHFIRIVPTAVTGRRFTISQQLSWWNELDKVTRTGAD